MSKLFIALGAASLAILIWGSTSLVKQHKVANDPQLLIKIDQMTRLVIFSKGVVAFYVKHNTGDHKIGDKYTFIIKNKVYAHQIENPNPPQGTAFKVEYLPENPDVFSIDPAVELRGYELQLAEAKQTPYFTLALMFVGLCGLVYSVKNIRKKTSSNG
jgi:hypothetical protein